MYTFSHNSVEILATLASKGSWTPMSISEITLLLRSVRRYYYCTEVWRQNFLFADDKLLEGMVWEWNCSSLLIFHYGGECQLQNPVALSREWPKLPLGEKVVWTRKTDSTLRTETLLAPARHLTKFLKSFGSTFNKYTNRDILALFLYQYNYKASSLTKIWYS